jgi:hypothetical protein
MAAKFLHIGCNVQATNEVIAKVQRVLNKAADWLRYAPNCWLVYTHLNVDYFQEKLAGIKELRQSGFFICEAKIIGSGGYLTPEVWEWLKESRANLTDNVTPPFFEVPKRSLPNEPQ